MLQFRSVAAIVAVFATAVSGFATASMAQSPADLVRNAARATLTPVDHSTWNKLLKAYVKPGQDGLNRVDYGAFKKSGHAALKMYVAGLEKVDPAKLDRRDQFAFFANLYNAKTIEIVLDHYPVKSIKDISIGGGLFAAFTGGPWKAKVLRIKGMELSLDDIEHEILRPVFKDPRVHYAVNCASIGCPNLGTEAFTGGTLEAQLDAGARAYINHPRGVTVSRGQVTASSIYSWFKADFGGSDKGVLSHMRKYASPELAEALSRAGSISKHAYDWRLNDTRGGQS
ncbi:MAG: DUF547 domain-containing protein [Alphaproteobacteria bacterium]|nr:DUF547 domain-containing protein [Alphaproteobacteria bacterium]